MRIPGFIAQNSLFESKGFNRAVGKRNIGGDGVIMSMNGIAVPDPQHCDKPGWPSCYDLGYDHGFDQANFDRLHGHRFNDGCPPHHSGNFCAGYREGYHCCVLRLGHGITTWITGRIINMFFTYQSCLFSPKLLTGWQNS